jgi:LPXTG-site transpeptidase (sortase) family protein
VVQAAYPAAPSTGTTYIYGHACHHHVCPFTNLKNAAVGDPVVVTTPSGVLSYRITRIGLSPRSADSLPNWAALSTTPNRLVLVTCQFEQGDLSVNNIVVAASLASATRAATTGTAP